MKQLIFLSSILYLVFNTPCEATGGPKPWIGTQLFGVDSFVTESFGITSDSSGNIYVTGYTTGDLDEGGVGVLTGIKDFFVVKYDTFGVKQWTRQLGERDKSTVGNGIKTDSLGNVYVTGSTTGNLDGNSLKGIEDFFVTKYNSSGVKQWTRQLGGIGASTNGHGITSDSLDNIYVAGSTTGNLEENSLKGIKDFFVTKYNSSGVKQWIRQLGAITTEGVRASTNGYGITSDSLDNVYVTGSTTGNLDGNSLKGIEDFFVTEYDSSGVEGRTWQFGVRDKTTVGYGITSDFSGNFYVTGDSDGNLDSSQSSFTGTRSFVTKIDPSDDNPFRWTRELRFGGSYSSGRGITSDVSENIYLTGIFAYNDPSTSMGEYFDFFVTKYNPLGEIQWTQQLGVVAPDPDKHGFGITLDFLNDVFVTGGTTVDLNGSPLPVNTVDTFVTKYNLDGDRQ